MNEENLNFFRQEPLVEFDSTLNGLSEEITGASIYFGTGLTTSKAMSVGLPFDVLGMYLLAEKIRRQFKLHKVIQLVADAHALSNTFVEKTKAIELANSISEKMALVSKATSTTNSFLLLKSSDLAEDEDYKRLYESIQTDDHEYVRREWTDILYLKNHQDLAFKLSWIIDPKAKKLGFDERLYDRRFNEVTGATVSFIYTMAGRTLDANRPKASPYIAVPDEKRIMLAKDESAINKLKQAKDKLPDGLYNAVEKHLSNIVELFCELAKPIDRTKSIGEQVDEVIQVIFS